MGRLDRGALGSSMMSGNSSEEHNSMARQTNQSRNSHMAQANLYASMDDTNSGGLTGMPVVRPNHRKYVVDKKHPKTFLDFEDFKKSMDYII